MVSLHTRQSPKGGFKKKPDKRKLKLATKLTSLFVKL